MRASRHGHLAVLTSDGFLSIHDASSLNEITSKRKLHNMPITSLCFKEEEGTIITAGLDYKYCIVPLTAESTFAFVRNLFLNMALLLLILLYVAEWLV